MPKSEEAERAVLGDILADPKAIEKIPFLKPDDFYSTKHQKIYTAAMNIHREDAPIDMVSIIDELKKRNELEEVGGQFYITGLDNGHVSATLITNHATIVKEKSINRHRIIHANKIIENCRNGADETVHSELLSKLSDLNPISGNQPIPLSSISDPKPKKYIIDDFIPENYPSNLYGESGQGKSLMALRMAASIATGTPFMDNTVSKGIVLYLDWELDEQIQAERWLKISRGMNYDRQIEGLYYMRMTKSYHAATKNILSWIQGNEPKLIIIDSVGKALADDPLDPVSVIRMYTDCENLGTVLFIDHQAKPGADGNYSSRSEFGSSYKRNLARSSWQIQSLGSNGKNSGYVIRQKKNNFGPIARDINYEIEFNPEAIRFIHVTGSDIANRPFGVRSSIISVLQNGKATSAEIFESIDGSFDMGAIRNELSTLKKEGIVIVIGKQGKSNLYGLRSSQSST